MSSTPPLNPFQEGKLILIDKPFGWSSFDVVNKIRISLEMHFGMKKRSLKVGHAGTLDPLATGLMLLCTGRKTREIELFQGLEKEYTGTFVLGATTPSFDLEKTIDQHFPIAHLREEQLRRVAASFVGIHQQEPPVFSAKKIEGKRAYEFARKGREVEMKKASVEISAFELTRVALPEVDFRIVCSKGTYIRSIARDFGLALESGAYLSALRRTRIGAYRVENASSPEAFKQELASHFPATE